MSTDTSEEFSVTEEQRHTPLMSQSSGDSLFLSQRIVASSAGGILTSLLMTPLDVVKTRLQAQTKPQSFSAGRCFLYCNGLMDHLCACAANTDAWYLRQSKIRFTSSTVYRKLHYLPSLRYTGSLDALLKIARFEGPTALYSGLSATLIMALPSTVIYYTSMDMIKLQLGYVQPHSVAGKEWVPPLAAIIGRILAVFTVSPLEQIRTKMQSGRYSWSQISDIVRVELRTEGISTLYRGVSPTLLRDVPFSAIYWFTYDSLKARKLSRTNSQSIPVSDACIYGAISGGLAGVLTLPFDVIKTHRQIELGEFSVQNKTPSNTFAAIQHLCKAKGVGALFSGLVPRLVKVIPASAVMIGSFEFLKNYFRHKNVQSSRPYNSDLETSSLDE